MIRIIVLLAVLLSPLFLSCGMVVPSEIAIRNERYYVDTLQQRWGRIGNAPKVTCVFFRSAHDTIVGTERARVIRRDANPYFFVRSDTLSNGIIEEEYIEVNSYYYSENTLEDIPDSVLNQVLNALNNKLSPAACKRMADNHTYFCVELLVGEDGYVLESCQYIFMDNLRIEKELLDFCARIVHAFNSFPYRFNGSSYMKENNIPHGPTRTMFMMTEEGVVHPTSSRQRDKYYLESKKHW